MRAGTGCGKAAEWKRRLSRYERTELTVSEFCREEGVSVTSLYQWIRKLAGTPQNDASEWKASRLPQRLSGEASASFRAIEVSPMLHSGLATIRLPSGLVIELPDGSPALKWLLQQACAPQSPGEGGPAC